LGLFPAGEVSSYKLNQGKVTDRQWQFSMLKFLKKARVPVVPVYFTGCNSVTFNILGFIHPVLRTVKLPSELLNKQGKVISIRIGSPISVREQDEFRELQEYGRLLRNKTYSLSLALKPEPKKKAPVIGTSLPIIEELPQHRIENEIESITGEFLLFQLQGNHVFCAPSNRIPGIMQEISRLREVTYRSVGEGTNKPFDRDRYDNYFWQLFIWDGGARKIVGGYRVGKGDQILEQYGLGGYYISSLFKIEDAFKPVLNVSLELGRSFIVREYQRKPLSLFLLWKGILYLLLKMPEYRYLIGPVSIPNDFREISKSLVVDFLMTNSYNAEFGMHIRPRNPFNMTREKLIDLPLFHRYTNKEIPRLEKFIQDIDPGFRLPVLLKKYLSVNSEVLGFNVDPLFNNCLDALVILDLFEVPTEMIESLSKEINDHSILDRFRK
jgi:putative hemolysin